MQVGELKIFSGSSNERLVDDICAFMDIPKGRITRETFPDNETFIRVDENIRGKDVFFVQSICQRPNEYLMELFIMIDAARRASAQRITAVLPFFGYARQDRKDQPRVPITAKLVANLIVKAGADRVLTLDLHAQQIQGFFDIPVDHLYAMPVFYDYLRFLKQQYEFVVCCPDVGGMKMASAYADMLECGLAFVAKKRENSHTVRAMSVIGDVKDKDVLLVDDMTETAGTLCAAADILKHHGARTIRAAVTHGVLNDVGYERLSKDECNLDELITTNSTLLKRDVEKERMPIKVLDIAPLLAQGILRINNHESVSSLFRLEKFKGGF